MGVGVTQEMRAKNVKTTTRDQQLKEGRKESMSDGEERG